MPARPLLRLPSPIPVPLPNGRPAITMIRFPSSGRQQQKFGPSFSLSLRAALSRDNGAMQLRDDPTALAPERVIVFEIAGSVQDFLKALARVDGLEFMAEYEESFPSNEDFVLLEKKKDEPVAKERPDKAVPGRFYLAMPDVSALRNLVSLWERWEKGQTMPRGFAPFANLFRQLRALRPWGPQDRISEDTVAFWREQIDNNPQRPVRTEVELWFRDSDRQRGLASQLVRAIVAESGGNVVDEAVIAEIGYHGMLIDIPAAETQNLMTDRTVKLALADEVMFLRPQSILSSPLDIENLTDEQLGESTGEAAAGLPIAALLDGVPVQAHRLLDRRLILDDPDNLQARAIVARRVHGTAMASLILHGDRNENGPPLKRPLYVRPVMVTTETGIEQTESDRLLVDTIHRAILRIKGSEGEQAAAPTVFLVNLSMGDTRRPFARFMSPLARLLDFLSARYNLLFLVSAGNVREPLDIPDFEGWSAFEDATPDDRERSVLKALNDAKAERTILSPAESLNALTIGAQHHDNVEVRQGAQQAIDPFADNTLPNVSCGLGLGYRRMIKPELFFPGGREYVRMQRSGGGLTVSVGPANRLYGLSAAAPDPRGQGRLDQVAYSGGTSSSTAMATRAGHRIFDELMNRDDGSLFADMDPQFYPVVVKSLLVHSARWNGNAEMLKDICGPEDKRRHVERADNSARFLGYGVPNVARVVECTSRRATLVGYQTIVPETAHNYRIPLPGSLERVTDPRLLTITIAWFSPVKAGHQNYRIIRMEAEPLGKPIVVFGVERSSDQPADATGKEEHLPRTL